MSGGAAGADLALVERAYGALSGEARWIEVMGEFNARFDLTYAMISTRTTGPTLLNAGVTSARPEAVREVLDYWATQDTRTPRYIRQATGAHGRWVSDGALYDHHEIAKSPLHHDYFRPRGTDDFIGTSMRLGDVDYYFLAGLPVGRAVPDPEELGAIGATLTHLVRAADLWIARQRSAVLDARAEAGRAALLRDGQGRWCFSGPAARRALDGDLTIAGGRLVPAQRETWTPLIEALANDEAVLPAVMLNQAAGVPRILVPHRVCSDPLDPFATGDLSLILILHETSGVKRAPDTALEALGLTPAEARLATRVGRAKSPADAAAELGISLATARGTLAVIYGKLGITRQAELVRLVTLLLH